MIRKRVMWVLLLMLPLIAAMSESASAQALAVQEGKHYLLLKSPQPVDTGAKIEVIEFFSYACPHCADFEPVLQKWLTTATNVEFRRVPVLFQPKWTALAKIFYTLDALDAETRLSPAIFTAIHRDRIDLTEEQNFFAWASRNGLDRAKVEDAYRSFAVATKVNRAKSLAQKYDVEHVPLMIVDGKYVTDPHQVGSAEQVPGVLDALIVKARSERKSTK